MIEDSFDDKMEYIKVNVMMNPYMNGGDLFKVVGLICFMVQYNRKNPKVNDPEYPVTKVIDSLLGAETKNRVYEYFKERLPLICEIFLQDSTAEFGTFGLQLSEIKPEVMRLLDEWIPF